MMFKTLLAAATFAVAGFGISASAQANDYGVPYGYGHGHYAPAPYAPVVVVPERTGVYFKRDFKGQNLEVKQCYKRRSWTPEGELFWSEVCN